MSYVNDLIEVKNLKKYFQIDKQHVVKAVDDVSFNIKKGETLGLVGESGCGKSTTGRTIIKLYEPTAGEIIFEGKDVIKFDKAQTKQFRKKAQMIFQDPYASLDQRMTAGDIIGEGIDIHHLYTGRERQERVYYLLETVGLNKGHASRYPHEFSGGQRQRIGIARALAIEPNFIICDEPISALDVSIQSQIINLLIQLQQKLDLTYLFISHDLSVVEHISDRVAVMYLGVIVELAKSDELYINPIHPYTQALLSAIPLPDPEVERNRERVFLEGDVPSPINPPDCCRFMSRCKFKKPICAEGMPELREVSTGHYVACHLVNTKGK